MAGAPKLTRVAPWALGLAAAGALVLTLARRPAELHASPRCDTFATCETACADGEPWACEELGGRIAEGRGAAKNPTLARELWSRACDGGDGYGCFRLALAHGRGSDGTVADEERADRFAERGFAAHRAGCDRGSDNACYGAAVSLAEGTGTAADPLAAERVFARLHAFWSARCDAGDARGCSSLAMLYEDGRGVPADGAKALELLDRACELGRALSCSLAGYRAAELSEPERAGLFFARGCALDDASSCGEAAELAPDGQTRTTLLERRLVLHGEACEANEVEACWQAAQALLERPTVTPADEARARAYKERELGLRQAGCDNGAAEDCASLAFTLREGRLVPRDVLRADQLAERACELGDAEACGTRREALEHVIDVSIGHHSCVVKTDGGVYCWGPNREGQLGDGTREDRDHPVRAKGIPKATAVDIHGATTCIRSERGEAWCWGAGFEETLRVDGGQPVAAIATGYELACALRDNGDVGCSGFDPKSYALGASAVRVGGLMQCAIAAGKLLCWGSVMQDFRDEPTPMLERDDVIDASVTGDGFCARFANGEALCRARALKAEPVREITLDGVRLIGGDADAGCAMRGDALWCWYMRRGELKRPFLVKEMPGVEKLVVRSFEGCALERGGGLACWYVYNPEPEPVTFQRPVAPP